MKLLPRRGLGVPPVEAAGRHWTVASSLDDLVPPPTDELIGLAVAAADRARAVRLEDVKARAPQEQQRAWLDQWPGEHYRLLRAFAEIVEPSLIVEVGTFQGLGSLALGGDGRRVVSYDIVDWSDVPDTGLRPEDGDWFEQRLGDLSDPAFFERERGLLADADLLFVDGPKDGAFEPAFLDQLVPAMKASALLILDDITFLTMVQLWRDLPLPKLDITSFGHWAGTGIAGFSRPGSA